MKSSLGGVFARRSCQSALHGGIHPTCPQAIIKATLTCPVPEPLLPPAPAQLVRGWFHQKRPCLLAP